MRAINHALTGAVIGLSIHDPASALPAAFLSHFALDALPHYGDRRTDIGTHAFQRLLVTDALLCVGLVIVLALWQPHHWLLAAICAFLATSPDFMWVGRYLRARAGKKNRALHNPLLQFHHIIQWFERPIGLLVELAWLPAMVILLIDMTR